MLNKSIKNIPLKTKIKVSNKMAFINLIVELGYREDKPWTKDEDELLSKLSNLADEHTKSQLSHIEQTNNNE